MLLPVIGLLLALQQENTPIVDVVRYCRTRWCTPPMSHIVCQNPLGKYSRDCSDNAQIVDLLPYVNQIVNAHNYYRNLVADGGVEELTTATRMTTMEWHGELAYFATLNVKQCSVQNDECRNTPEFHHTGQNIIPLYTTEDDPSEVIRDAIETWFNESSTVRMADLRKGRFKGTMAHFTVMIQENNNKVGCALLRDKEETYDDEEEEEKFFWIFTCNYATSNVGGRPVYTSGKRGSDCDTGINTKYRALCSPYEIVDVNYF